MKVFVGEIAESKNFGKYEVIEMLENARVKVRFLSSGYETTAARTEFRRGQVKDWSYSFKEFTGKVFSTLSFGDVEVLDYQDAKNVKVRFLNTGFEGWYPAGNIKTGKIMDYLAPALAGVGYIGIGPWSPSNQPKAYRHWAHMLRRCYTETYEFRNYHDKWVDVRWHNFQNFVSWAVIQVGFNENGWQIDKDILLSGNETYGPETCCFVPSRINSLVIKSSADGTKQDRFGTHYFRARDVDSKRITKGFKDWSEGKAWYKETRESIVKKVADQYKNVLDSRVYEALYSWQVN